MRLRRKERQAQISKTRGELVESLTRREREILALLAQGYSAPEIARHLTLALSSVKWYVQQVYGKLGVNNKQRAILRAGELGLLEKQVPAASVHFRAKQNLPSQLTSFIGREKEIEAVNQLIAPDGGGRLLTLTGAGGSGKTRLALQVADQLRDVFPDGVWFIEIAPLTDPALVPQSLLTSLGLVEQAGRSALAILSDFLQAKRALLIIDNCEHLIQACAHLVEALLRACPTLHILTTSREALSVAGETLYLVPTLTTPDPSQPDLDSLPHYEAVQLFVERAQTALPSFRLTVDNRLAVAQVCHQLDGIPLALELAAARVKILRVEQIAARLAERDQFRLLTTGSRTAPPRHQTLHALIDWSHDLLSKPERVFLRRLAVFADGWTLAAAESVCVGDGVEADAVLDLLTQLVNKSLILSERVQGKEARYQMLETIRHYTSERLLEAGEGDALRNRHLNFFVQWAEQLEPKLRGPQQLKWLDRLENEHDNLRAALEWSLGQAEHRESSLRLAGALPVFWNQRGHISEGLDWLEKILASWTAPRASGFMAKALYGAGFLACWLAERMEMAVAWLEESASQWRMLGLAGRTGLAQALATLCEAMRILGDPAAARSLGEESVAICRIEGDRWGLAYALTNLGMACRDQDEFEFARSVISESVALWRELGDLWGLDIATHRLGEVAIRQGEYEEARRHFADCLVFARKLRNPKQMAWTLLDLANVALNLGDWGEAKAYTEEYFNEFHELGSKYSQAISYCYSGHLALIEGDSKQAQHFYERALELAHTSGPVWLGAGALMGLAQVAAVERQAWRAARLLGSADERLKAGAAYWDAFETSCVERATATAMAQIGEAQFAAAQAEGREMSFEQAAEYALKPEASA